MCYHPTHMHTRLKCEFEVTQYFISFFVVNCAYAIDWQNPKSVPWMTNRAKKDANFSHTTLSIMHCEELKVFSFSNHLNMCGYCVHRADDMEEMCEMWTPQMRQHMLIIITSSMRLREGNAVFQVIWPIRYGDLELSLRSKNLTQLECTSFNAELLRWMPP